MKKVSSSRIVSCCAMFFVVSQESPLVSQLQLELARFHDYFKHHRWQSSLELENPDETCLALAQTTQTSVCLLSPFSNPRCRENIILHSRMFKNGMPLSV